MAMLALTMSADVVIYRTPYCPYCVRAAMLLKGKGVAFREVDVSDDPEARERLVRETGQRTVPQIFINGASVGGYERPLSRGTLPPLIADVRGQLNDFTASDIHPQLPGANVRTGPGHLAGQALTRERTAGGREVERGLPIGVRAAQAVRIVIERIRAARAGVEQHPQKSTLVLSAPTDVVKHHGLMKVLSLEQPLHHFHGHDVALIGFGRRGYRVSIGFRAAGGVEQPFGQVGRRA